MLRTVHLTGPLRQFSKKPVEVFGATTRDVVKGLICMFGPRFKQIIRDGEWMLTRGKKLKDVTSPDETISEQEIEFNLGKTETVYFCAAVKAKSAVARIVVGVVLIVASIYVPGLGPLAAKVLMSAGVSLVLGGVAEMLAPKVNTGTQDQAGQNASFLFNGTVNVTEQGGPVPIIYGTRFQRASSVVLSAGISTETFGVPTGAKGIAQEFLEWKKNH